MSQFALASYPNSPMPRTSSPLANSTRIQTDFSSSNTSIIINNYNYNQIIINEGESTKSQKSVGGKKQMVISRKSIAPKKTTVNAIKPAGNAIKKLQTVERILNQINMTKYTNLFKNYDLKKFKELRELDLNAMGITRPQELRTLKEAINKAKAENANI